MRFSATVFARRTNSRRLLNTGQCPAACSGNDQGLAPLKSRRRNRKQRGSVSSPLPFDRFQQVLDLLANSQNRRCWKLRNVSCALRVRSLKPNQAWPSNGRKPARFGQSLRPIRQPPISGIQGGSDRRFAIDTPPRARYCRRSDSTLNSACGKSAENLTVPSDGDNAERDSGFTR